jgi:pyruvate/2-oxoglutarate dehydrogenase complex dihydrolipoamide dehydrogenase (E3) component
MKQYAIAVIGGGSGGLVAALTAKRRGARVALLEKNKVGGECTHSGCIPSKTLISSARLYHALRQTAAHGLPSAELETNLDFARVMEHVDSVVQIVYRNEQPEHFRDLGIDVYLHPSGAQFTSSNEIHIGSDTVRADYSVIATGSSPRMISHEGSESLQALTNENFWELRKQPRSIAFLGGGVISVELGQSLARFGTHVTIVERNSRILHRIDEEVGELAADSLRREGVQILTDSEVVSCQQLGPDHIKINIVQNGVHQELFAESIFAALGRTPNCGGMRLERAGVQYTRSGIVTNEFLQTTAPNIYACGDVTTPAKFTHVASYQADICVENILQGNHRVNDLSAVPWAIFMEPEIGHIGLTEMQARRKHGKVNVSCVNTASVDRFITESETAGFLKLVLDENDVILGADAIGAHAGEWVQFFTLAMKSKMSIQTIADTIFTYPIFSEIVKKAVTRYLRNKPTTN